MTTTNPSTGRAVACRPPLTGPLLREVFPVPPVLRLDDVGAVCPLDDVVLARETDGWSCPACGAAWNPQGRDGWWPITAQNGERVDQADAGAARVGRLARAGIAGVVAAGPAAAVVTFGHRYAEHADAVPQEQVFTGSAAVVGLVGLFLAGRRVVRWVDERRHPLAVDVDEDDLDAYGRELLARVRAARQARGEVA